MLQPWEAREEGRHRRPPTPHDFLFVPEFNIGAFSIEHLDIVWNPFDKIGRVLVLNCQHLKYPTDKNLNHQQHHLFINFFH